MIQKRALPQRDLHSQIKATTINSLQVHLGAMFQQIQEWLTVLATTLVWAKTQPQAGMKPITADQLQHDHERIRFIQIMDEMIMVVILVRAHALLLQQDPAEETNRIIIAVQQELYSLEEVDLHLQDAVVAKAEQEVDHDPDHHREGEGAKVEQGSDRDQDQDRHQLDVEEVKVEQQEDLSRLLLGNPEVDQDMLAVPPQLLHRLSEAEVQVGITEDPLLNHLHLLNELEVEVESDHRI